MQNNCNEYFCLNLPSIHSGYSEILYLFWKKIHLRSEMEHINKIQIKCPNDLSIIWKQSRLFFFAFNSFMVESEEEDEEKREEMFR